MDFSYIHHLINYLHDDPHAAYVLTFVIALVESLAIIGSVIPGSVTMTAIGILIGSGVMSFVPTLICAMIGAFVGDFLSYWIGKYYNDRLWCIWPFRHHPRWLAVGEEFFKKHGGKSVILGRFFGPVRSLVPLVAGMMRMSIWRFVIASLPSVMIWALIYIVPGIVVGALSLELPKTTATKFILLMLCVVTFSWLILLLIHLFFKRLMQGIDAIMQKSWACMVSSTSMSIIQRSFSFPEQIYPHKQLTRIVVMLVCLSAFLGLFLSVYSHGVLTFLNDPLFVFFRSLRNTYTDPIMIVITFLGEKAVLLSASVLIAAWMIWHRAVRAGFIYLGVMVLSAGAVAVMKYLYYSARPEGLLHSPIGSSFPSGHAILVVAAFGFLAFLLAQQAKPIWVKTIYSIAITFISLVAISRLYLGAHWLTDVLAAIMLGLAFVLLGVLLYLRRPIKVAAPLKSLSSVSMVIIVVTWMGYSVVHFREAENDYTLYWPKIILDEKEWWKSEARNDAIPLFVVSRFDKLREVLNVQWIGDLDNITRTLLAQGWVSHPIDLDLKETLRRLSIKSSAAHLPLLPTLYHNKIPIRLFTYIDDQNRQTTLMLWKSLITLEKNPQQFWLGSVFYYVPHNLLEYLDSQQKEALYNVAIQTLRATLHNHFQSKIIHLPEEKQPLIMRSVHWNGDLLLIKQ